jgi:hypothetical protein
MDIVNFDALKAQGKVLPAEDVDLTEDYFIIGKRNVHYNTNSFKATEYPIYAIKAGDVMGGGTTPAYKVYTALLTQLATDPPVPTILENTLGNIVWSYDSLGTYKGTLTGAFLIDKYFAPMPLSGYDSATNSGGGGTIYNWFRLNDNEIVVLSDGNDALFNSPFEIRVYN